MNRRPTNPSTTMALFIGALLLVGLGGLWAVRQLASWWDTGQWVTGPESNPLLMAKAQVTGAAGWTGTHTFFAGVVGVLVMCAIIAIIYAMASRAAYYRSLEYRSKRLGNGADLSLKAAQRKANVGGLLGDSSVAPGLLFGKVLHNGRAVYTAWREGLIIIMGPGGGKTRGIATPLILAAPGTVFATSNKRDIADQVRLARERKGRFLCFDPQSIAGYHRGMAPWWWNIMSYVSNETRALSLATMFAKSVGGGGGGKKQGGDGSDFFAESGKQLLARLLLAAAVSGHHIDQVFVWLSQDQERQPVKLLHNAGLYLSAEALDAEYKAAPEQRSGVFATARSYVTWLENRDALSWIMPMSINDTRPQFSPEEFVRDTTATLIALSKEGDGSLGPITGALTKALLDAAEEYANECGGRLPIPLVCMLDEAANCAPIPDLPAKYSFYGGMGISTVTILQTPHQAISVWGETGWKMLWDASTIRIIGSGVKDREFASALAEHGGKYDHVRWNVTSGERYSTSSNTSRENKIEIDDIFNLAPGQMFVVHNNGSPPFFARTLPIQDRKAIVEVVSQSVKTYGPRAVPSDQPMTV